MKKILWAVRIFSFIILGVVLTSGFFGAFEQDTIDVIVIMMTFLILIETFRPSLSRNKKLSKIIIAILTILLFIGIALYLL